MKKLFGLILLLVGLSVLLSPMFLAYGLNGIVIFSVCMAMVLGCAALISYGLYLFLS